MTFPAQPLSSRPSRLPRGRRIVIGLVAVSALVALGVFYLWQSEPGYWRQAQAFSQTHNPDEIRALADSVHTQLAQATTIDIDTTDETSATGVRATPGGGLDGDSDDASSFVGPAVVPGEVEDESKQPRRPGFYMTEPSSPRTITLDRDQLRAWVMTHLDAALENAGTRLPRAIQNPVLDVQAGRFVLGFEYDSPEIQQVISVYFRLGIEDDGRARVLLDSAAAGQLPIPIKSISKHMRKNDSHPTVEAVAKLIDELETYRFDPVMPYDGQRNVRVLGVDLDEDTAKFTVRFEPKEKD